MPAVSYQYIPVFGVESYKDNNGDGGAEVTNDNLLITLWDVEVKDPFDAGDIFVPNYANDNVPVAEQAAYKGAVKSRDSARFYLEPAAAAQALAVLNPSQEYRQQMADAVVYNGGPVGSLASYSIKKSLQCNYFWHFKGTTAASSQNFYTPGGDGLLSCVFSTYLDLGSPPGTPPGSAPVAFLKTNGADGVAPEFFDRSTSDGVKEMIAAVNRGEFYVGVFLTFAAIGYIDITYPHSVARG